MYYQFSCINNMKILDIAHTFISYTTMFSIYKELVIQPLNIWTKEVNTLDCIKTIHFTHTDHAMTQLFFPSQTIILELWNIALKNDILPRDLAKTKSINNPYSFSHSLEMSYPSQRNTNNYLFQIRYSKICTSHMQE